MGGCECVCVGGGEGGVCKGNGSVLVHLPLCTFFVLSTSTPLLVCPYLVLAGRLLKLWLSDIGLSESV